MCIRDRTATYIAGIFGSSVTGDAVTVSSSGQLGIVMSSARYKRDIHDMDATSSNLMKLRPVTFRYKDDPAGTLQYGLVAEEVEKPVSYTHLGKCKYVFIDASYTAKTGNPLGKICLLYTSRCV